MMKELEELSSTDLGAAKNQAVDSPKAPVTLEININLPE